MAVAALPVLRGEAARRRLRARRSLPEAPLAPAEAALIRRLFGRDLDAEAAVRAIIAEVRTQGDAALRRFASAIDGYAPDPIRVTPQEFAGARAAVSADVAAALRLAAERLQRFHERQRAHAATSFREDGVGQIVRALQRVGLYVPGTRAVYPSSVLHAAIPARVAGVEEISIVTPALPTPGGGGAVSALKLVAAEIAGVSAVYRVGGAHAIAAMAYGTESVPAVDKICGPGGRFVTLAKRQVFGDVGIDAIYGPTETMIIADAEADPEVCAADLLAQAEHDELAAPWLLTPSAALAEAVAAAVPRQAATLPRAAIALAAFTNGGGIVVTESLDEALELANAFAPEHLALLVPDAERHLGKVRNAGGIFLGEGSPEALADYLAGPSHVMPTSGSARFASALSVADFLKISAVVNVSEAQLQTLAPPAATLARAEGLEAHARSLDRRRADR
jgi:histidinol dehydrogenase